MQKCRVAKMQCSQICNLDATMHTYKMELFCKNSSRLKAVKNFCKILHHRCFLNRILLITYSLIRVAITEKLNLTELYETKISTLPLLIKIPAPLLFNLSNLLHFQSFSN